MLLDATQVVFLVSNHKYVNVILFQLLLAQSDLPFNLFCWDLLVEAEPVEFESLLTFVENPEWKFPTPSGGVIQASLLLYFVFNLSRKAVTEFSYLITLSRQGSYPGIRQWKNLIPNG